LELAPARAPATQPHYLSATHAGLPSTARSAGGSSVGGSQAEASAASAAGHTAGGGPAAAAPTSRLNPCGGSSGPAPRSAVSDAELELQQLEAIPTFSRTFAQTEKIARLRQTVALMQRMYAKRRCDALLGVDPGVSGAAAGSGSAVTADARASRLQSRQPSTTTVGSGSSSSAPSGGSLSAALAHSSAAQAVRSKASGVGDKPLNKRAKATAGGAAASVATGGGGFAAALCAPGARAASTADARAAFAASLQLESRHAADGRSEVIDRVLARADTAERVEAMEAAMAEVTSKQVTRWFCADCERWFDRPPTMCHAEGHAITSAKKTQFAYRCDHCTRRVTAFERLYVAPCANCGHMAWTACSIYSQIKPGSERLDTMPVLLPTGEAVENSLRSGGMVFAGEVEMNA
jgi:hypothetical protein